MATRRQPILLLSPPSEFYAYLLKGLSHGLKAHGYPSNWLNVHIEQSQLAAWVRRSNACAVIEINRVLAADVDWPAGVAHCAWIQDYRAYGKLVANDLGVSDHLYFLVQPSVFGVDVPPGRAWSILSPGVRTDVPPTAALPQRDFCFAGFIPAPPDVNAPFSPMPDGGVVTLGDFLAEFPVEALQQSRTSLKISNTAIDDTCARIGCAPVTKHTLRQFFDEDLVRIYERRKGSLWPQFAPYYRGFVSDARALDRIFHTTRINLHNSGLAMHFRVLDCMAAGAFILVNETPLDLMAGGIRNYFEPDRDYGSYTIDKVADCTRRYLVDDEGRRRIGESGRAEVLRAHTDTHRAQQILADFDLLPRTGKTHVSDLRNTAHYAHMSLAALAAAGRAKPELAAV